MSHRTNEQLLADYYAGDERAFEILYNRLRPRLRGEAYSRLPGALPGRWEEAEGVVQQGLTKVAKTRGKPSQWQRNKGTVNTWAYRIIRNVAVSLARGWHRQPLLSELAYRNENGELQPYENTLVDSRWESEQEARRAEQRRLALQAAIADLPHEKREIVEMYYYEGKTYKQIAKLLGVVPSTARRWLHDCLADLREILGPEMDPQWGVGNRPVGHEIAA